jgi:hypothetical protein
MQKHLKEKNKLIKGDVGSQTTYENSLKPLSLL